MLLTFSLYIQYALYSDSTLSRPAAAQTTAKPPAVPVPVQKNNNNNNNNNNDPGAHVVSDVPIPPGQRVIGREEKVEYRDQHGNLLSPEQVKALEGKVEFRTKYETRTRLVDSAGHEVNAQQQKLQKEDETSAVVVAPPHPDVDPSDPETALRTDDENGGRDVSVSTSD